VTPLPALLSVHIWLSRQLGYTKTNRNASPQTFFFPLAFLDQIIRDYRVVKSDECVLTVNIDIFECAWPLRKDDQKNRPGSWGVLVRRNETLEKGAEECGEKSNWRYGCNTELEVDIKSGHASTAWHWFLLDNEYSNVSRKASMSSMFNGDWMMVDEPHT